MAKKPKWIGILGGSFDPPHLGHLLAATYALKVHEVDEVWFVPAFQHAFAKDLTDYRHRLAMVRRLIDGMGPKFKISTIERDMKADGRTLPVLKELARQHRPNLFSLIVGSDAYAQRSKWYRFDEIEKRFMVLVVPRGNNSKYPFGIPDISSTEVRRRLIRRKSLGGLVTPAVANYIGEHDLYR